MNEKKELRANDSKQTMYGANGNLTELITGIEKQARPGSTWLYSIRYDAFTHRSVAAVQKTQWAPLVAWKIQSIRLM